MRVFQNLSSLRIRGFLCQDHVLRVFFFTDTEREREQEVKCLDVEKAKELLEIGIGTEVKLYNVRLSYDSDAKVMAMTITANSGIRVIVNNVRSETPPVGPPALITTRPPPRWHCLMCNWLNYSSCTVCFSCNTTRKQGPEGPASLFSHLHGPPYTHDPWTCQRCFARKNSYWRDECWKCGQERRKKKQKWKR
jgi:hypothetical protein